MGVFILFQREGDISLLQGSVNGKEIINGKLAQGWSM